LGEKKMTLACNQINDTTGICSILEGTGYGLGVLFQALGASLPSLLLVLAVIGGVVAIILGVAYAIKNSIGHSMAHTR